MTQTPAAVLDTNAVLDWLLFADPAMAGAGAAVEAGTLRWLATAGMRDELARVVASASLHRWTPDVARILAAFARHAVAAAPPSPCGLVCRDADDQVYVDLALAQGARWLLTRDKALLRLSRRAAVRGTVICTPGRWSAS